MNEAMNNLLTRRSVRKYKPDQITDAELNAVLEAGLYAPTGMGAQKTIMVAVRDKETRDLLSRLNAQVMGNPNAEPFYGAPCVVVVLSSTERFTWLEDGSLVMGNMMNAANAMGLGSCWIHRAAQVFETPEGKELLEKWGVPADYKGVGNCILGYADDTPAPKPRAEGRIIKVD